VLGLVQGFLQLASRLVFSISLQVDSMTLSVERFSQLGGIPMAINVENIFGVVSDITWKMEFSVSGSNNYGCTAIISFNYASFISASVTNLNL
jgi:hypothetical protein